MYKNLCLLLCSLPLMVFAHPDLMATSRYYLPQTAVGSSGDLAIATRFTVSRVFVSNPAVQVNFYTDSGDPWPLTIESAERPELNGETSSLSLVMTGGETLTFVARSTGAVAAGWTEISSDSSLAVSSSYLLARQSAQPSGHVPLWEAGVVPSPSSNQLVFQIDGRTGSVFEGVTQSTGVAVSNPGTAATTVSATLKDHLGNVATTSSFSLPSKGHQAQFVSELFPGTDLSQFAGTVTLEANVAICAIALQGATANNRTVNSTLPVYRLAEFSINRIFDTESNDSFETAQALIKPVRILGSSISSNGTSDVDYYIFSSPVGAITCITVLVDSIGSGMTPTVELFDSQRNLLATGQAIFAGADDQSIRFEPPAFGNYYLRITGSSGIKRLVYEAFLVDK